MSTVCFRFEWLLDILWKCDSVFLRDLYGCGIVSISSKSGGFDRFGGEIRRAQYRCIRVPVVWTCLRGSKGRRILPRGSRHLFPWSSGGLAVPHMRCCQVILPTEECRGGWFCPEPTIRSRWKHFDFGTEESLNLRFPLGILCSLPVWVFLAVVVAHALPCREGPRVKSSQQGLLE